MNVRRTSAVWHWVLALAVAALVFVLAVEPILGHDLFWHLKAGEAMFVNREILRSDIFSYTAFGAPWINSEWLSQIFLWVIYELAGLNAFLVFKVVFTGAIALLVYAAARALGLSRPTSAWAAVTVILFSHLRIQARPHLMSDALTAFYAFVIYRYVLGKQRKLWFLLPLQVLWANVHGGAVFGVEMLILVAAGECLQARFADGPTALDRKRRVHLVVVAVLSALACLVNPWGVGIYTFAFDVAFRMKTILGMTWEWTPSWEQTLDGVVYVIAFRAFLVVALASFIVNRKRVRLSHLFLAVIVSAMAFRASRFVAQFFIICVPLTFANFKSRFSADQSGRKLLPVWAHAALILNVVLFFTWFGVPISVKRNSVRHVGTGLEKYAFPEKAVDFLEQNDIRGRGLNEMYWGGYLTFRRWPMEKVHIDGRTPIFGDEFYGHYIDSLRNARNFSDYLDEFDIDYVLLGPKYGYLHEFLWDSPRWRLVFADNISYVYLRRDPGFERIINKHAMKRHPMFE